DERMLTAERNNFLAAVFSGGKNFGLAFADLTTGDFMTTEVDNETALLAELQRLRPAEIICPAEARHLSEALSLGVAEGGADSPVAQGSARSQPATGNARTNFGWILNAYDDWVFAPETAVFTVRDHFKVASLDGFGLKDRPAAVGAAGGILHY